MHKTNEDSIQHLVSALMIKKQQFSHAVFTTVQAATRPADSLKNKFFYLETEANKLEKEYDHILAETDPARQIKVSTHYILNVPHFFHIACFNWTHILSKIGLIGFT